MINEEKLYKLYDIVVDNIELTTKKLKECGFTSSDIANLVKNETLERIERGLYIFKDVDKLLFYGKKLIYAKEFKKANNCFFKCYQIDPNNYSACFRLFVNSISENNYEEAFKYFDVFYNSNNSYYQKDYNFYLYLLNIITDIPDKYKETVKNLKLEDLMILKDDKRYQDIDLYNKVRKYSFKRKFVWAVSQLNEIRKIHQTSKVQDFLIDILLKKCKKTEKINQKLISNLLIFKKYSEIIAYFNKIKEQRNLSQTENYILKLIKIIEKLKIDNKVVECVNKNSKDVFEAIDNNDYDLALTFSNNYVKEKNLDSKFNFLGILLNDISNLINEIKSISSKEELAVQTKEQMQKYEYLFPLILSYLMKEDYENTYKTLKVYLKDINKSDYMFLIVDLIKLSILENDNAFTKPMTSLANLSRDNITLYISLYLQDFYLALANDEFKKARIYLDIITNFNNLGLIDIKTNNLLEILNLSESILDDSKDANVVDDVDLMFTKYELDNIETDIKDNQFMKEEKNIEIDNLIDISFNLGDYLESTYQELLENKGIVLLKPMDNETNEVICDIVNEYPFVEAFIIEYDNLYQVVMKYDCNEHIDIVGLAEISKKAFNDSNYDLCIESSLKLLHRISKPCSYVWEQIGLSYLKLGKLNLALDYLLVANELTKNKYINGRYYNLISKIKIKLKKVEENKRKIKI